MLSTTFSTRDLSGFGSFTANVNQENDVNADQIETIMLHSEIVCADLTVVLASWETTSWDVVQMRVPGFDPSGNLSGITTLLP